MQAVFLFLPTVRTFLSSIRHLATGLKKWSRNCYPARARATFREMQRPFKTRFRKFRPVSTSPMSFQKFPKRVKKLPILSNDPIFELTDPGSVRTDFRNFRSVSNYPPAAFRQKRRQRRLKTAPCFPVRAVRRTDAAASARLPRTPARSPPTRDLHEPLSTLLLRAHAVRCGGDAPRRASIRRAVAHSEVSIQRFFLPLWDAPTSARHDPFLARD